MEVLKIYVKLILEKIKVTPHEIIFYANNLIISLNNHDRLKFCLERYNNSRYTFNNV